MLYWNEIFKVFIPRICWLYGNNFPEFFSWCGSYQAKITQVTRSCFICKKFPSLFYLLFLFPDIFVWAQICFSLLGTRARCRRSVVVTVIVALRKRELSQKLNLCLWGAWKFPPKKSMHRENAPTFCNKNTMARVFHDW